MGIFLLGGDQLRDTRHELADVSTDLVSTATVEERERCRHQDHDLGM
jgi:hypothetical protein